MHVESIKQVLYKLYQKHFQEVPAYFSPLPKSGSNRQYYRLSGNQFRAIGVYNPNLEENEAFVYLTRHFYSKGLPVPRLFAYSRNEHAYLIEDLGDDSLYQRLQNRENGKLFPDDLIPIYQSVLDELLRFQTQGIEALDTGYCYPVASFNRQSMWWDLYYFKYYFLMPSGIMMNEKKLDEDFSELLDYLEVNDNHYFMYRDFQSRNIVIKDRQLYFIDYQGGRKGPLQYDVASLLYQAKAQIPESIREKLLDYYVQQASKMISLKPERFKEKYQGFAALRIMQTLGAYGLRGLIEKKAHFLSSLPLAYDNLMQVLQSGKLQVNLPWLSQLLSSIPMEKYRIAKPENHEKLLVNISSFSYKKGLPEDTTAHGGGFVFDCRSLPNPGRDEQFRMYTGKDPEVINYLKPNDEVNTFLNHVLAIIEPVIENYRERDFRYLAIHFGCTGGQHRSVYCAEHVAGYLKQQFDVDVHLHHRELESED